MAKVGRPRKRVDPKSHLADGQRAYDQFHDLDPGRDYKLVNPNDDLSGLEVYEAAGWESEVRRPGGPRSKVGKTVAEGQVITVLGQVLVSRPLAESLAEYQAGQMRADAFDRRILKTGNIEDGMRGQTHEIMVDRELTSAPFVETEGT